VRVCVCFSSGSKRKDYGKNVVFQTILRLFIVLLFPRSREYKQGELLELVRWGRRIPCIPNTLFCRRQRRNRTSLLGIASFRFIFIFQVRIARNGKEQPRPHSGFFILFSIVLAPVAVHYLNSQTQETRFWVSSVGIMSKGCIVAAAVA